MRKMLTGAALLAGLVVILGCSEGQSESTDAATENKSMQKTSTEFMNIPLKTITGEDTKLADYSGKVLLLVNTASKCGYTRQYEGLEALYEQYKDSGLVVIGFPANNFGGQEPGSNEEILEFCQTRFSVSFPMMAKISVKGDDKHPLYKYLTEEAGQNGEIGWNFEKFLIDREGNLAARFETKVAPSDSKVTDKIKELL